MNNPPLNSKSVQSAFARFVLALIAFFTKLLYKTLRISVSEESAEIFSDRSSSAVFSWHESISMLPYINKYLRHSNSMTGLMSASKDGAYLAYFFSFFGVEAQRGSSSKYGGRSAVGLIRILRDGGNVCITPDGPRGPAHTVKDGMFTVCSKCEETRMIFINVRFSNSWKFKSWDGFNIPKPFSKVEISACEFENLEDFDSRSARENLTRAELAAKLLGGAA